LPPKHTPLDRKKKGEFMAWVKIDDAIDDNPKWFSASLAARGLWATSIVYASHWRTAGRLPSGWARREAGQDADALTRELVEVGLWVIVDGDIVIPPDPSYAANTSKAATA
jgi:hypothetical protein